MAASGGGSCLPHAANPQPHSPNTLIRRACVAAPHCACNSCIEHFYSFGHRQPKSIDILRSGGEVPPGSVITRSKRSQTAMELVGLEPELCHSGPRGARAGSPGMTSVLSHTARDVTLAQARTQRCYKEGGVRGAGTQGRKGCHFCGNGSHSGAQTAPFHEDRGPSREAEDGEVLARAGGVSVQRPQGEEGESPAGTGRGDGEETEGDSLGDKEETVGP